MRKAIISAMFLSLASLSSTGASAREFLPDPKDPLKERYRPQFHYTTIKGWINDPIGLVVHRGEYHIFNDHNPFSTRFPGGKTGGEQSHWSHAISTDLVHWRHMPIAVYPDRNGACWSGSGVVDRENTAGFRTGGEDEPPIILAYTNAGAKFGQSLAYSNDRGRTWKTYEGNPVLAQIARDNRDPMVFRHEPTTKWVMVLYVKKGSAHFFTSDDLKKWTPTAEVRLAGFHECPDLFELPVDGDEWNTKWVLYDARFQYWLGSFDGREFTPEAGPLRVEHGRNFYAAQTWDCDYYRRVQIGWMRNGRYPGMPFNQQMSFPCELTLRSGPGGVRLYRYPVPAIEKLHTERVELNEVTLGPGEGPLCDVSGDLFDIRMEVESGGATEFGVRLHDQAITYARGRLSCLGASANVAPVKGRLRLRILVDRASIEVFANDGEASLSSCFLPKQKDTGLTFYAKDGEVRVRSLVVAKLKSAWTTGEGVPGRESR
ncbi:MAG: glycoside hydrolase family 32 protein [Planctomycetota bacterium]